MLITTQPLELALSAFLQSRLHGHRQIVRAGSRSGRGGR
jgi:hypothetical protein